MAKKIVMLTGQVPSSNFMYHGVSEEFEIMEVIQEEPVDMKKILRNRAKRLGYFNVLGQILFGIGVLPFIRKFSKNKYKQNLEKYNLNLSPIPENKITRVPSVNDPKTIEHLQNINPDIVIVNGCRIISSKVLNAVNAIFINTHEGITPRYRGIHGAYWALVNRDKENCGVTVHLVDKGVDTGGILYQGIIHPDIDDCFTTYPMIQTAKGIELMKLALKDALNNDLKIQQPQLESQIWYHPTIGQYLYYWLFRKIH